MYAQVDPTSEFDQYDVNNGLDYHTQLQFLIDYDCPFLNVMQPYYISLIVVSIFL